MKSKMPEDGSIIPPMDDISITVSGVQKLLRNLNPVKASAPDGISPRVFKELSFLAEEMPPILTTIYCLSISSGEVPAN